MTQRTHVRTITDLDGQERWLWTTFEDDGRLVASGIAHTARKAQRDAEKTASEMASFEHCPYCGAQPGEACSHDAYIDGRA